MPRRRDTPPHQSTGAAEATRRREQAEGAEFYTPPSLPDWSAPSRDVQIDWGLNENYVQRRIEEHRTATVQMFRAELSIDIGTTASEIARFDTTLNRDSFVEAERRVRAWRAERDEEREEKVRLDDPANREYILED